MKLIAKRKDAQIYKANDCYVIKATTEAVAKRSDTLYKWFNSEVGRFDRCCLIRENNEVLTNGYAEMLKSIPTDFRYYRLIILWTQN